MSLKRVPEKLYDFAIVAKGRSGTHMLASYLNSHPELRCEGEWGKQDKKVQPSNVGRLFGGIIMYNVLGALWTMDPKPKVLHLERNVQANATSFVRQIWRYRMRKEKRPREDLPGSEFRLTPAELKHWCQRISREVSRVKDLFLDRGYEALFLRYEDLIDRDGVGRIMTEDQVNLICGFLEVESLSMSCAIEPEFRTEKVLAS